MRVQIRCEFGFGEFGHDFGPECLGRAASVPKSLAISPRRSLRASRALLTSVASLRVRVQQTEGDGREALDGTEDACEGNGWVV